MDNKDNELFAAMLTPEERKARIEEMILIYGGLKDAFIDDMEITRDDKIIRDGLRPSDLLRIASKATLGVSPSSY